MKFTVDSQRLESAAKQLSRVINPKNPLPILSCILCKVHDNGIEMMAYDGETYLSCMVGLAEQEGDDATFYVDAKSLTSALASLNPQPLTIEVLQGAGGNNMVINHQTGSTYFPLEDAVEYPDVPDEECPEELVIDTEFIKRALKRAIWTTANDDLRPQMTGVFVGLEDGCVNIVASDGHSLALTQQPMDGLGNRMGSFLMPRKAANLLLNLPTEDDDELVISWNDKRVKVDADLYTIVFSQIEGTFPNYHSVIRASSPLQVDIPVGLMISAIKKVLPFSNSSSQLVRLSLSADKMHTVAEDYDFNRGSSDSFDIEYSQDDFNIGCEGKRMLNLLSHLTSPKVTMGLHEPNGSIIFTEKDGDAEITLLCMPMLLSD